MSGRRAGGIVIAILVGLAGLVALTSRADLLHQFFTGRSVTPDVGLTPGISSPEARATLPARVASDAAGAGGAMEPIGVPPEAGGLTAAAAVTTSPALPATVTLTPQPPFATGTPLPFRIVGPLAIDGPRRKLYARVQVNGAGKIGVFSAEDGGRVGVLNLDGGVAVDPKRGRLLVDDPGTGLHVLDAENGAEVKLIQLPPRPTLTANGMPGQRDERSPGDLPRVQPAVVEPSGQVAIARGGTVWIVDVGDGGAHPVSLPSVYFEQMLDIEKLESPAPGEPVWILAGSGGAAWGNNICVHRLTDLEDAAADEVYMWYWSAFRSSLAAWSGGGAVMAEDLYEGARWEALGQGQGKRSLSMHPAELTWLPGRNLLLAQVPSPAGDLLIVNPLDMTVVGSLPVRLDGRLAGYDREGDRLLVTTDTQVQVISFPEESHAGVSSTPERSDVRRDAAGDTLVPPQTLVDLDSISGGRYRVGQGQGFKCRASPTFDVDQTAFCGAVTVGLYRTTDGGRTFQTAMAKLPSWAIDELNLSPGFAQDRTLFVSVDPFRNAADLPGTLYRSSDGGKSWRPVGTQSAVAFAPDFERSRRMYAFGYGGHSGTDANQAYRSDDAGVTWRKVGQLPDSGAAIGKLYAFDNQETGERALLAIGATSLFQPTLHMRLWPNQDARIYRSTDDGRTWVAVMTREGVIDFDKESIIQTVSPREGQALFVLGWEYRSPYMDSRTPPPAPLPDQVSRMISHATTLRSYDLGATWQYVERRDDGAFPDPDRAALAIYTLPTSTPQPSATPAP